MSPSQSIGTEVRVEAARQGISIREVARRMNVDQMWLSRRVKVNATTPITPEEVERMAEALDVPVERLVSGWLPRLDSNQQPSDSASPLVSRLGPAPLPEPGELEEAA